MIKEEILKQSGDFNLAQWCLLFLFSVVNVFSAFHYFAQTFITLSPRHVCSEYYLHHTEVEGIVDNNFKETDSLPAYKWKFETLTTELNWTCQGEWKSAVVQSMFFVGSVTGTLILGIVADSFGRKPVLIISNLIAVLGNLMTIYLIPNIWFLSIARFIAGLATDSNFFMMYIIVMEYIKPRRRTIGLNLCIGIWYCVGCMLTPWLAVLTGNWKRFLLSISLPTLLIPILCLFVPESAEWFLSVGRTDDAIDCFIKLSNFNKKNISQDVIERFKLSANENQISSQKVNLLGLFKTPRLRRKTCILIFKTIVLTLCYDAMSRNIEGLQLDPFIIFTISSASIFPSCVVILLFQDKIGRKPMAVFSLLFTGLFNFCEGFCQIFCNYSPYFVPLLGLLGRFFVNIAYNSGTQYAAELIPTQVRGQGLAAMHVFGYGATFFSPHILYLSNIKIATPEWTLGILSVTGATFCLFLPETLNKPLPCTLQDGEAFGEKENIWNFLKRKKCNDS